MAEELQSLLEKIQNDGIKKAEAERDEIIAQAQAEAAKIIKEAEYDDYAETWRLFHTKFTRWEDMPQDTSLQRAYVELIKRGEKTGKATGVFFL
jgi:regulator of protease activity HflC (stomatin/prohibitin superfamily)